MDVQLTEAAWIALGYPPFIAEALEGQEISTRQLKNMSSAEVFEQVLNWHGIIGYAQTIIEAYRFLESEGRG